jgi:hypothetical protein
MSWVARIDEMDHLLALLVTDIDELRGELGPDTVAHPDGPRQMAIRRSYVRAVFAAIEAMVEQHARLLLDLSDAGIVTLSDGVYAALSPTVFTLSEKGKVVGRPSRVALKTKVRAVYREAPKAYGNHATIDFSGRGWRSFSQALLLRHSLTHPKRSLDCYLYQEHLDTVRAAEAWYQELHNDYIRMVREHLAGMERAPD